MRCCCLLVMLQTLLSRQLSRQWTDCRALQMAALQLSPDTMAAVLVRHKACASRPTVCGASRKAEAHGRLAGVPGPGVVGGSYLHPRHVQVLVPELHGTCTPAGCQSAAAS